MDHVMVLVQSCQIINNFQAGFESGSIISMQHRTCSLLVHCWCRLQPPISYSIFPLIVAYFLDTLSADVLFHDEPTIHLYIMHCFILNRGLLFGEVSDRDTVQEELIDFFKSSSFQLGQ